jgi:hypothetical protein
MSSGNGLCQIVGDGMSSLVVRVNGVIDQLANADYRQVQSCLLFHEVNHVLFGLMIVCSGILSLRFDSIRHLNIAVCR